MSKVKLNIRHCVQWIVVVWILLIPFFLVWGYNGLIRTKGEVLYAVQSAAAELEEAALKMGTLNLADAYGNFVSSYQMFQTIDQGLGRAKYGLNIASYLMPKGRSYYYLYKSGIHISRAGVILSDMDFVFVDDELSPRLQYMRVSMFNAQEDIMKAALYISKVNVNDLPVDKKDEFIQLQKGLLSLANIWSDMIDTIDHFLIFIGINGLKRYALLFQNSLELRPSGGFIGSMAILDIKNGEIQEVYMPPGGSYDIAGNFNKDILSPMPFRVLNKKWEMQDCNWFPDFPTSAQKCMWFIEGSTGASLDGAVAINVGFMEDILKILGPIPMPQYKIVITSDNFIQFTQALVESKSAKQSQAPKQFLSDLFPILIDKMFISLNDSTVIFQIIEQMTAALRHKDIAIYVNDQNLQSWFEGKGWSGSIKKDKDTKNIYDYLHVNAATVNGGKSDFNIKQTIYYTVEKENDGRLAAYVKIAREHQGKRLPAESFFDSFDKDFNFLTTQPNLSYIRIYAPYGSELIDVSGDIFDASSLTNARDESQLQDDPFLSQIEHNPMIRESSNTRITEEFGKTVFGNYMLVAPGKSGSILFSYYLPMQLSDFDDSAYQLLIQNQSGIASFLKITSLGNLLYDGKIEEDKIFNVKKDF